MITFAAFYIELAQPIMAGVHRRVPSVTVTDPHRFTRTMFASARHFHSDCRTVVLSDRETTFPVEANFEVIRLDLDPTQPMLARSTAWLAFIQQATSHIVYLDSDMLINANLDHLFLQEFDVGLTYRDNQKWPINAGINFVHGARLEQAYAFYQRWLAQFQAQYMTDSIWGGDQDAVRDLVDRADFTRTDSYLHAQGGTQILMLPCELYNFSTADEHGMDDHYPAQKILHFKGRRKPHMIPYAKKYLQRSD